MYFLKYTVLVSLHQMCTGVMVWSVKGGCLHEEEDTIACYQAAKI